MSDDEDRYVVCDSCGDTVDCHSMFHGHIFILYKEQNPSEEMVICEECNVDFRERFAQSGYTCDDWEDSQE